MEYKLQMSRGEQKTGCNGWVVRSFFGRRHQVDLLEQFTKLANQTVIYFLAKSHDIQSG